jgi:Ni2+-binding GTPase involved in maturation of urease and hydrogenase
LRIVDIMTRHPLAVGPDEEEADLQRLAALGRLHHLPLIDGGRLVGMWVASAEGPLVMIGPEQVHQTTTESDAEEAFEALLSGKEAVLAWEAGEPRGVVTRADAMAVIRSALARGIGRRHGRPVVVRLVGPDDAGKGALLLRTLPLLRHVRAGVVRAAKHDRDEQVLGRLHGVPLIEAPEAHWRAGLHRALENLSDVQMVLIEDADGPAGAAPGVGEDHQVLVVSAGGLGALDRSRLSDVAAIVITRLDAAPEVDFERTRDDLRASDPDLPVLGVAVERDDRGLDDWRDWLLAQVLPAQH